MRTYYNEYVGLQEELIQLKKEMEESLLGYSELKTNFEAKSIDYNLLSE